MGSMAGGWGATDNNNWDPTMLASPAAASHVPVVGPVHPQAPALTIDNVNTIAHNLANRAAVHPMSLQPYADLYAQMYSNLLAQHGATPPTPAPKQPPPPPTPTTDVYGYNGWGGNFQKTYTKDGILQAPTAYRGPQQLVPGTVPGTPFKYVVNRPDALGPDGKPINPPAPTQPQVISPANRPSAGVPSSAPAGNGVMSSAAAMGGK